MSILEGLFQGIVQGLTEFLPVSSSGHLSIIQHFTGITGEMASMFTVLLHMGTLIAVIIAFRSTILKLIMELWYLIRDIFTGKLLKTKITSERKLLYMLMVAQLPMIAAYFLSDFYESFVGDGDIFVEGICFLITAVLLLMISSRPASKNTKSVDQMSAKHALIIGGFQAIAPLPGISRSGATISGGVFCGLNRELAVEFSFIMGIPAVLMANLLEFKDIAENGGLGVDVMPVAIGVIAAIIFGLLAIFMVRLLIKGDKFKYFAYYLIVFGIAVITAGLLQVVGVIK